MNLKSMAAAMAIFSALMAIGILIHFVSPVKYVLFAIQVTMPPLVYLLIREEQKHTTITFDTTKLEATINVMILLAIVVLTWATIQKLNDLAVTMIAITIAFFLPGYALLRFLQYRHMKSWIEWPVLSFALSMGLTSIIYSGCVSVGVNARWLILATYAVLSALLVLRSTTSRVLDHQGFGQVKFTLGIAESAMLLSISLGFLSVIACVYPQMAHQKGLDIVRHFSEATLLVQVPDVYQSVYPWFHMPWATIITMLNPSFEVLLTGLSFLGIIFIAAFYVMARMLLNDSRMAVLSTLFFSFFAGFGWIALFSPWLPDGPLGTVFRTLRDMTYWDIGSANGPWLWLWFRPMTVSLVLIFVLVHIMLNNEMQRFKKMILVALLVLILGLVHLPELLLFQVILFMVVMFAGKSFRDSIRPVTVSSLLGVIVFLLCVGLSGSFGGFIQPFSLIEQLILMGIAVATALLSFSQFPTYENPLKAINHNHIAAILLIILIAGLLSWLSIPNGFSAASVSSTYFVPIILYPLIMGVAGMMLPASLPWLSNPRFKMGLKVAIVILVTTVIVGKSISILNAFVIDFGYGERRFLPLVLAMVSVVASVPFMKKVQKLDSNNKSLAFCVILIVVFSGLMSTLITIEYRSSRMTPPLDERTLEAIEFLSSPTVRDARTPILTVSDSSRRTMDFVPSPYRINRYRMPVWGSLYPDIPLILLQSSGYPSPYVYLTQDDQQYIQESYFTSYLASHMSSIFKEVFSNEDVECFEILAGVPPSYTSDLTLVTSEEVGVAGFYAYEMLYLGGYNYTVSLPSDVETILGSQIVVLSEDTNTTLDLLNSIALNAENEPSSTQVVIINQNGFGPISNALFDRNTTDTMVAYWIENHNSTLLLPSPVECEQLSFVEDNATIIAWYANNQNRTALAAKLVVGNVHLVYMNIFPIIKELLSIETLNYSKSILEFRFDESTGGSISDYSGNSNTGTLFGPSRIIDSLGFSLSFDGVDDYVEITNAEELNETTELSIEAWISPERPDDGFTIISKIEGYKVSTGYGYMFDGTNFLFNSGNGTTYSTVSAGFRELEPGRYYHVAVTVGSGEVNFYVDGSRIANREFSEMIAPDNLSLIIGKRHDDNWLLNGSMNSVAIHNSVLTPQQINQSYTHAVASIREWRPLVQVLGSLYDIVDIDISLAESTHTWAYGGSTAFFQSAKLQGECTTRFSALASFTAIDVARGIIHLMNETRTITGIEGVHFACRNLNSVACDTLEIIPGKGFYVNLRMRNPVVRFLEGEVSLTVVSENITQIFNVELSELTLFGDFEIVARTPLLVDNSGMSEFKTLYTLYDAHLQLPVDGDDILLEGNVGFKLMASDTYTFISEFTLTGTKTSTAIKFQWNEVESILQLTVWSVIVGTLWCVLSKTQKKLRKADRVRKLALLFGR